MTWHPRPDDPVFNRILRITLIRGFFYGFAAASLLAVLAAFLTG